MKVKCPFCGSEDINEIGFGTTYLPVVEYECAYCFNTIPHSMICKHV